MSPIGYSGYREYLSAVFETRRQRNKAYSLRSFARDLGMGAPSLSEILNAKKGVSIEAGYRIGQRLGLAPEETSYFCDLIQCEHGRSESYRALARERIESQQRTRFETIDLEQANRLSWADFAIAELLKMPHQTEESIAQRLDLETVEVRQSIQRLQQLAIIDFGDGHSRHMATPSDVPSPVLRQITRQMLRRGEHALAEQTLDERDFSTLFLMIRADEMAEIKKKLKSYRRQLASEVESDCGDDLYCLSTQLFRVGKKPLAASQKGLNRVN